jgi:Tol biopolymer transport system component
MITEKKKGYLLFPGILLFQLVIYSCISSIKVTPNLTYTFDYSRNTTTEINPTITISGKGMCEKRRDAALFEIIPRIDPDGKIAYSNEGIFLINPNNNLIEAIYPVEREKYPGRFLNLAWSPDGTMLSVIHQWVGGKGYSLEVIDFPNGQVCSLLEGRGELSESDWSPNSQNISVVDMESGELINIEIPEMKITILSDLVYSSPQWIDNLHISYLLWNSDTELRSLVSLDIQNQEKVEYFKESRLFTFLFSPDGIDLAYSFWDQFVMNITNFKNGITNIVDAYIPMEWTRDGQILLAETAGRSMVFITLGETMSIRPVRIGGVCRKQAFSSDDSMVVITKVSDGGGSKTSFIILNINTDERKELDVPYCCPQYPVWSPNPGE